MYVSVFDGNSKYVSESRLYLIAVFLCEPLIGKTFNYFFVIT